MLDLDVEPVGELLELTGQRSADDETLDLVGALVDLGDLGVAHVLLDGVVLAVAVAAEELHRVGGHLHGGVGGEDLAHGGDLVDIGGARVDDPRRVVDQLARGLDLGGHVGEHELDRLVRHDGLAELTAVRGVAQGPLEGALGEPEGLGGDPGSGAVEGHHGVFEADVLLVPHELLGGHPAVGELELVDRHRADAHGVFAFADDEARGVLLDDEGRDPAHSAVRVGQRVHGEGRGDTAVCVPLLLTVENVLVTVLDGGGPQAAGVGAGRLFGQPEGDEAVARGDGRQVLLLLFLGAADDDGEGAERVDGEGDADAAAGA